MQDQERPDWLGDDGEFIAPVDDRYGVYSPFRRGYWWRFAIAGMSFFSCGIVAIVWWMV